MYHNIYIYVCHHTLCEGWGQYAHMQRWGPFPNNRTKIYIFLVPNFTCGCAVCVCHCRHQFGWGAVLCSGVYHATWGTCYVWLLTSMMPFHWPGKSSKLVDAGSTVVLLEQVVSEWKVGDCVEVVCSIHPHKQWVVSLCAWYVLWHYVHLVLCCFSGIVDFWKSVNISLKVI